MLDFALKKGKIGVMRTFMHGAEAVMGGLPSAARNRFKIHFKAKKFVNGKVEPSTVRIYESFVEAHRARPE